MNRKADTEQFPGDPSDLLGRSACPVCGAASTAEDDVGPLHYDRCVDCGLTFMNPIPTQSWYDARYAAAYWQGQARSADPGEETRRRLKKEHLRAAAYLAAVREIPNLPDEGTLLEVGCGAGGAVATVAAGIGWRAEGVEPDVASRAIAARIGVHVDDVDLSDLVARGRRFDVILLSHVLEHVVDPVDFLRQIVDALADDGHLVIEVPNGMTNRSLHLFHPYLFTTRSLTTVLQRHGLAAVVRSHGGASSRMRRHFLLATATRDPAPTVRGLRRGRGVGRRWAESWKRGRLLRRLDGWLVQRSVRPDHGLLEDWSRALATPEP